MLNWSSIIKFSVFHFVAITLVSTLTTLLIGADNLERQTGRDLLIYFNVPTFLVGSIILTLFAKTQSSRVLLHLLITVVISSIVAFIIVSALMGAVYISPTWFIDLSISVMSILVAIFIGGYYRGVAKNAT